jgi:serine/threonine-protein kinase
MFSAAPIADRIGPYRVVRALGSSGALCFMAREEGPVGFTREVVLKLVANPRPEDGNVVKQLAREATICSKLNHPNIIRTHDFFEYEGHLVLVLEHVDGISLDELLTTLRQNGPRLSDDAVFYIGVAILEALAHAHAHTDDEGERAPVVHRAVSPETVALGKDGTVKLGGFGLAKILSEDPDTLVGPRDANYMAPEQKINEKVDVYAAGLLLWQLLTGRPPGHDVEPLSNVRRDLPRELLAAIDASLEPTAQKRTISCADMASWIKKVAHVARGRKEVRELVTPLAAPSESGPERTPATPTPLLGWTARPPPLPSSIPVHGPSWLGGLTTKQQWLLGVGIGGLVLILLLAVGRGSSPNHHAAGAPASAVAPRVDPTPPPLPAPAPTAQVIEAEVAVAPPPAPPPAPAAARDPGPEIADPEPPQKTKFGFLTVHSPGPYTFVYVNLLRYGHADDRLIVPCGRRFVSIGIPNPKKGEPTWLAPSEFIKVPCGGQVEATILPRKLR